MTRVIEMFDSVDPGTIPRRPEAVAGYVDGHWADYQALRLRYPHAHHLPITVFGNVASMADVEPGDMNPGQIAHWVHQMMRRNVWRPGAYADRSRMPAVKAALARWPRGSYRLWLAAPGIGRDRAIALLANYDAVQYDWRPGYDHSVCRADFFPPHAHRRHPAGPPPPAPPKRPHPKTVGASAGAALTAGIVAILHAAHVHVSPELAAAIATIAAAVGGTISPARR